MSLRISILTIGIFLSSAVTALGQSNEPWRAAGQPQGDSTQPGTQPSDQPGPQTPMLKQQPAPAAPAQAPFTLTPAEQSYVDQVLKAWETYSDRVKTFETKFVRREYDPVFGPKDEAKFIDQGVLRYKKPDKGAFEVEGDRPERWISDGRSFFEFNYTKRQLIEHQLPPEMQGQAIEDGPVPFVFGAKAEKLKRRYWIRPLAAPSGTKDQIWLEAWPRHQRDAANFQKAQIILSAKDMMPLGIALQQPNGKSRTSYTFYDAVVNDKLAFLKGDPFKPSQPFGWTKKVEPAE